SLARPAYSRSHVVSGDLIVIVDQSYGMQARDVRPSRFAAALARARALASELAGGNVMSVIGMGAQPHLAIAESSNQGAIDDAVNRLRVGIEQPNFLEALSLATSLARTGQNTRAVVLTSRDSGISTLPLPVTFPVDIVRIGGHLRDLGITDFSASQRPSAAEAVVRVSNFGAQMARSDLELFVNGHLSDVRPLAVPGHGEQNLFWSDLPSSARQLRAQLTSPDNVGTDKSAWAVVPGASPRRVLLVSRGDYFLEAALVDNPAVQLSLVPPAAYRPGMERAYDFAIFDGFLPQPETGGRAPFPLSSTLLIAPPSGQLGPLHFAGNLPGGTVEASSGGPSSSNAGVAGSVASILRYVDLSDVHVAQSRSVALPSWLQPLASAGGTTVLAAGEHNTTRFVLVDFDLQHSDWPLRISFPVVLQNVLPYLAPGLTLGETNLTAGRAVTFFPPPGTREIDVVRPDGVVEQLSPPFPLFTDTARSGLYTVRAIKESLKGQPTAPGQPVSGSGQPISNSGVLSTSFAVNFFPARPAPAAGPATLHTGHVQSGQTLTASVPVSLVWVFELLALGVFAVEWWIAFRGMRLA
ncbi:MAG: VWA domain-containing protein, partial [Chloroflexota bacterium]|nr:VWA domain-containing protein [Chloroflexota bacterium]